MIRWLKGLYWNIQRVIRWIPIIWEDREFDSTYFLQILSFKLKLMEEFYRSEYAISVDSENCARKIHICKLLCDRLIAEDYFDWLHYEDYMRKQDLRYLCEILQKHLFSWWD